MDEPAPALVSTNTLWPASTSAFTPEGTTPTRNSWSLTSLGTPMIMVSLRRRAVPFSREAACYVGFLEPLGKFAALTRRDQSARAAACRNNPRKWTSTHYRNRSRPARLRDVHCPSLWCRQRANALQRR